MNKRACGAILSPSGWFGEQICVLDLGHTGPHIGQNQNQIEWGDLSYAVAANPVTPTYYQGDYVMRIIEDFKLDFLRGTVVKYLLRAGNKVSSAADTELVDLEKARWYLDHKIQQLKKRK